MLEAACCGRRGAGRGGGAFLGWPARGRDAGVHATPSLWAPESCGCWVLTRASRACGPDNWQEKPPRRGTGWGQEGAGS